MKRGRLIAGLLLWLGLWLLNPCLARAQSAPRANPSAPLPIKPFGDLAWDDSFSSAVQKIKRWPGIAQCRVEYSSAPFTKFDLLPLQTGTALSRELERILGLGSANLGRLIVPGQSQRPRHRDWRTGQEWEYFNAINSYNFKVIASPVMINAVPFEINVTFNSSPGAILYLQKNVTMSHGQILIPLVISGVSLASESKALNQNGKSIEALLLQKYGTRNGADGQGNRFEYSYYAERFSIRYLSNLPDRLGKLYNQYLTNQAVQDGKRKPDLSDGL